MDIIDKKIYKNPYILIVILITWIKNNAQQPNDTKVKASFGYKYIRIT